MLADGPADLRCEPIPHPRCALTTAGEAVFIAARHEPLASLPDMTRSLRLLCEVIGTGETMRLLRIPPSQSTGIRVPGRLLLWNTGFP